jgi:amidase
MMSLADYASHDALGLAELLRRREVTPRELANCALAAIAAVNPRLNAVVDLYHDAVDALGDAALPGPFHGVPILTKDFPLVAGRPAELGSIFAKGYVTREDSVVWERWRDAGLVNLGRTASSEFGIAAATESSLYGPTHNPWDLACGVAGSSGGSAAAVAAGIVPCAHGSDGGGSIRTPASFCGVVGLKPSRGRVSSAPDCNAPLLGLATEFMLTKSIRDTAALLDLVCDAVPGDGYEICRPTESYLQAIATPPKNLRIALCTTSWSGHPLDAEVVAAAQATGRRLEQLGHVVEEASPAFDYAAFLAAQKVIWAASCAQGLDEMSAHNKRPIDAAHLQSTTLAVYRRGKELDASALIAALAVYDSVTRKVGQFLARFDVLVTPTCAITPEVIGTYDPNRPGLTIDDVFADLAPKETFSALFNGTGSPAMSLPLGQSKSGLPIGIQFVAAFGREDLLLRLGQVLEQDVNWRTRRPPVHVSRP